MIPENRFSEENVRFWIRRRLPSKVALLLGMTAPALLLYVTFWQRAPLIQEARDRMVTASALEGELITLKSGWSEDDVRRITEDYRATVGSLVGSYEELAGWLSSVGETARLSGFRMAYRLGVPTPLEEEGGLTMMTIDVTLDSDRQRSGYLTMLALLRHLVESRPGVTLADATVKGDTARGANKIDFTLGLVSTISGAEASPGGAV